MRFVLVVFMILTAYLGFMVGAAADHMDLTRMLRIHFACYTKAQSVAMIEAESYAASNVVLAPGGCYQFNHPIGVPAKGLSYEGTFHDPMSGRNMEVYRITTSNGEIFFTSIAAPEEYI